MRGGCDAGADGMELVAQRWFLRSQAQSSGGTWAIAVSQLPFGAVGASSDPASLQEESLHSRLVPSPFTPAHRGVLSALQWKCCRREVAVLMVLFLLSLVRQGCIKREFALLDAQNSPCAQGVPRRAVPAPLPPAAGAASKGLCPCPGCLLCWVCSELHPAPRKAHPELGEQTNPERDSVFPEP